MMKIAYIYLLIDPNTGRPRYVGQSVNPIQRYSAHKNIFVSRGMEKWITGLHERGQNPLMTVIKTAEPKVVSDVELETVLCYAARGERLFNRGGMPTPEQLPRLRRMFGMD